MVLDELDRRIIRATQSGLPLVPRPYEAVGASLGIDGEQVRQRLQAMLDEGLIRRIGAVPNHYRLGFSANGMSVWDVADDQVDGLGERLGDEHATMRDARAERQPVLLTTASSDNPNDAGYLFLIDQASGEDAGSFERCFELFNGRDEEAVSAARNRWRWATAKGFACIYWQQEPGGKWVKGGASRAGNAEL